MHRQQDLFQTVGQLRSQISSDGDQMARQTGRFPQDGYVRLFAFFKSGIIVIAERSGRYLFCQNQVDEFALRVNKNITDFPLRSVGLTFSLGQKLEALLREEELRQKIAELDSGSSKAMTFPRRSSRRFVSPFLLVKIKEWYSAMPPFQRLRSNF